MPGSKVQLIEVSSLSPIEGHGPKRALWLRGKIEREGVWTTPLKVEKDRHLVMDGHHRFEVAKAMNLRLVPAILFSYDEVEVYSLRKNITVSPDVIFQNFESGVIFPYKTAKHNFPLLEEAFAGMSLNELR